MKNLIVTTGSIFLSFSLWGQPNTFLGLETAVTNSIYEFSDSGDKLKEIPLINGSWGVNVRQDLNRHFSVETGLIRNTYSEGYVIQGPSFNAGRASSAGLQCWQIPLRMVSKINLFKSKIYFKSTIGYHFCINSSYDSYGYSSSIGYQNGGDSISSSDTSDYRLAKTFPLLETSAGFEFKLFKKAILAISINYFTGFKRITQMEINYKINNNSPRTASAYSKGEYWSLCIGLCYPIDSLWRRKKQE